MKVLVAHPAQQHSYRLASALNRCGMLYRYVTTVYCKSGSLTEMATRFLRGKYRAKALSRRCPDLEDSRVVQFCEAEGLIKLLTLNLPFLKRFYKLVKYHTSDRFAREVARYAIQEKVDAVVCYDDSSAVLFDILAKEAPEILRIMDMSAANILYMREIYERDMTLQPEFAPRLKKEREIVWNKDNISRAQLEMHLTNAFLVPSGFVARSLQFSGVSPDQIQVCPYGVDVGLFSLKAYPSIDELKERPIRFAYVGGVKELKGISYLLQAFAQIPQSEAVLTVVGQANPSAEDIRPYAERVRFAGSVLHDEVPRILADSDVFIFASLGEGMALSILEAAACGLPLIISENSGVNDQLTEGVEGYTVPIQSADALFEKARWFIDHPEAIEPMGRAARKMALRFSWENYDKRIAEIFATIGVSDGKTR